MHDLINKTMENQTSENNVTPQSKIIKPDNLRYLDIHPHLKSNIIDIAKNCKEPINEYSYYCFTCKHSVCSECGLYDHNDHLLIQRENCLKYDQTFFVEIGKVIDESLKLQSKKELVKGSINKSIDRLQAQLEQVRQSKLKAVDEIFNEISFNLIELKQNFDSVKESIELYYKANEDFFNIGLNNIDRENTVFLMNFEIMNLCDNKNLEVLESITNIKEHIVEYNKTVDKRTTALISEIEHYLDMEYSFEKFDDFYWDVKLRTKKYSDQIKTFRSSIYNIIKTQGSYDKLNDLVEILDSKNKKGIDLIFNQEYFLMRETIDEEYTQRKMKVRGNSKTYLRTLSKSSGILQTNKSKSSINAQTNGNSSPNHTQFNPFTHLKTKEDISLDNRILQRFFAYSILDTYGKLFSQKKDLSNNMTSVNANFMSKFTARNIQLKEYAKPVIGTNTITIYNKKTNLLNRVPVTLDRDTHGYIAFPDGCRHILVEDYLYITGGVDYIKSAINVVLRYDIKNNKIERLNSLIRPHSYHTIEYLENYDCLVVVGGEMCNSCELLDLYTCKWTKLPDLNYARANASLYHDNITSDIYALFGMEGSISNHSNNSDKIEVLEMKDISSGWFKVDYYKSADLNLKLNHCAVIPFTKDTLLIYGGIKARVQKKLFALYHLNKNEVLKADDKTLEQIKIEEKKIKNVDQALEKMKTVSA